MRLICYKCKLVLDDVTKFRNHGAICHPGKGAYGCEHCDKRWFLYRDWLDHSRVCSGAQPLSCADCDEGGFLTPRQAVLHDHRAHGKGAPLNCPKCDRLFVLNRGLLSFLHKTHQALASHTCESCRVDFQTLAQLNDHRRSKHGAGRAEARE